MSKKYSLSKLLRKLHLSKSSYNYCKRVMQKQDKCMPVKEAIRSLFHSNYQCYGVVISEKVICRLMKEDGL